MTDIYYYEVIQINGKTIIIKFKSDQRSGLAINKNAFWISMLFDFIQSDFQKVLEDSLIYVDVFKKLKKVQYFNHYDYKYEEDSKLFGDIVEDWELLDVVKINDDIGQSFDHSINQHWQTEATYKINFSKEEYLSFLKVGDIAHGA